MLSVQGAEVHSLVRELRSHMLHGTAQIQTREKPHDIEFGSYLLAMIPKAKVTKEKIDKLNYAKSKACMHQRTLTTE